MYKLIALLSLVFIVSACTKTPDAPTTSTEPAKTQTGDAPVATTEEPTDNCTVVPAMDTAAMKVWESGVDPAAGPESASSGKTVLVNYTLRTCTEDGPILDTSRESDAKIAGIYQEGRSYEPFPTMIGSHMTVRGFEYGLIGMKKGERKTIAVAPVDGYGEAPASGKSEENVPKYYIAPEYTMTLDKSLFADTLTEVIKKEMLGEEAKDITVGSTLTGGENKDIPAKVIKISGDDVTLEIDNKSNPFYGKKLEVGTVAQVEDGVTFTIKSLEGTGVTFDIVNQKSPFFGKYTVGTTVDTPVGKVTLKSINTDDVTILVDTPKDPKQSTLFFDVEVVDIK